jgi:hypothetical protein
MIRSLSFGLLLLFVSQGRSLAGQAALTLLEGPGFNQLQIRLDTTLGSDTENSTLTGTVEALFGIDPDTDTASQMTIVSGDVTASDVTFRIGFLLTINATTNGMGGTVFTKSPPGAADPATSTFDASLHRFLINRGTITGSAVGTPINIDLATSSFAGTADGIGSFELTRLPDGPTAAFYSATLTTPVNIVKNIGEGTTAATVTDTGTLTAATAPGTPIQVSFDEYQRWTECNGIPGAPPQEDSNLSGAPNGITWALGLSNYDDPKPHLLQPDPATPRGFVLPLPPGGTAAPITVQISHSLAPGSWVPALPGDLSTGVNPIPAGTTGQVTLSPSAASACFVRMSATP